MIKLVITGDQTGGSSRKSGRFLLDVQFRLIGNRAMTQLSLFTARSSAVISSCGLYRYALHRRWDDGPQVLFCMLNPSTADETNPDPTMTKCLKFAKRWGYGSLAIGNLFGFRATEPRDMLAADEPVGPDNDVWLRILAGESQLKIAAWGANGGYRDRDKAVLALLQGHDLHYLRLTKEGHPGHPLFLPGNLTPILWRARS
jgi:hypothetical protein